MLNRFRLLGRRPRGGAFAGVFFGILLCLGAVVLLWTNEGRVDLSRIAREAAIVAPDGSAAGGAQVVSVTGALEIVEPATDPLFGIRGEYLQLTRNVEMYAWVEHERDDHYNYELEWTAEPPDSGVFEYPEGHINPPLPIRTETFSAMEGRIGHFTFDPSRFSSLPAAEAASLGSDLATSSEVQVIGDTTLYIGKGSPQTPEVGDVRITYQAVQVQGTVTLFGQVEGNRVEPYLYDDDRLYGVWPGNHEEALAAMHRAYTAQGWAFRVFGVILMWIGLSLVLHPLTSLLGRIPLLGRVGQGAVWVITLVVALGISIPIILASLVVHHLPLLLFAFFVLLGITMYLVWRRRRVGLQEPAPAEPPTPEE